jgi:hypothetical protein
VLLDLATDRIVASVDALLADLGRA